MFSSVPELFLNSIWLPAQTDDYKPQHPYFVVFRILPVHKLRRSRNNVLLCSSPTVLLQALCKDGGRPAFRVQRSWLWTGKFVSFSRVPRGRQAPQLWGFYQKSTWMGCIFYGILLTFVLTRAVSLSRETLPSPPAVTHWTLQ